MKCTFFVLFCSLSLGLISISDGRAQGLAQSEKRENCTRFDLQAKGEIFENYAFQDQMDDGACYAFAASKMYDAVRFKGAKKTATGFSPTIATASTYMYGVDSGRMTEDSGQICDVFDYLASSGSCTEAALKKVYKEPAELIAKFPALKFQFNKKKMNPKRVQKILSKIMIDASGVPSLEAIQETRSESKTELEWLSNLLYRNVCGKSQAETMRQVGRASCVSTMAKVTHGVSAKESERLAKENLLQEIENNFILGMPSGLGICSSGLWHSGDSIDWTIDPNSGRNYTNSIRCGPHATVLIGREWRSGACRYKIFDSNSGEGSQSGIRWVTEDMLSNNLLQVLSVYSAQ